MWDAFIVWVSVGRWQIIKSCLAIPFIVTLFTSLTLWNSNRLWELACVLMDLALELFSLQPLLLPWLGYCHRTNLRSAPRLRPILSAQSAVRPYYLCLAADAWEMSAEIHFANSSGSLSIYISEQHIHLKYRREYGSCNVIGTWFSDISWSGVIGCGLKSEQNGSPALLCLHS